MHQPRGTPETMEDLHDTNIPHRMTPAYEEESLFVPGDPARRKRQLQSPSRADRNARDRRCSALHAAR